MSNSTYHEKYETIHNIISKYKTENFEKVNFYGVITFIGLSKSTNNCTSITLVDKSCVGNEKLKCVIFSGENEVNTIKTCCEVGDIFRCHRFKVQNYRDQPQGVCNHIYSSWIRFKRNEMGLSFEGNKNSSIDEKDQKIVKELREWLKTNPCLDALYEANISIPPTLDMDSSLEVNKENTSTNETRQTNLAVEPTKNTDTTSNQNNGDHFKTKLSNLKLVTFSRVPLDGYFDVICQACAVCESKGVKFLLVWDGTKSKYAVHQENDFSIAIKQNVASNNNLTNRVFCSKLISEYLIQVYVFDEYVDCLDLLDAGDYVLMRNVRSTKPKSSNADLVIKIPGSGSKYQRTILKLASSSAELNNFFNPYGDIQALIRSINEKGKELKVKFQSEDEFKNQHKSCFDHDETFDENFLKQKANNQLASATSKKAATDEQQSDTATVLQEKDENKLETKSNNTNNHNLAKPTLSKVDILLKDISSMYSSDDDDDEEEEEAEMVVKKKNDKEKMDTQEITIKTNSAKENNDKANESQQNEENIEKVSQLTSSNRNPSSIESNPNKDTSDSDISLLNKCLMSNMNNLEKIINEGGRKESEAVRLNVVVEQQSSIILNTMESSSQLGEFVIQRPKKKEIENNESSTQQAKSTTNQPSVAIEKPVVTEKETTTSSSSLPNIVTNVLNTSQSNESIADRHNLCPKKNKQIDPYEICNEIYKLKRLTNLTYLAPYVTSSTTDASNLTNLGHIPYFLSLKDLANEAANRNYMKCKVTAKLFNYAISSCPHIASVFVNCKHCNYVNFTPFHLASMHQLPTLNAIISDFDQSSNCSQIDANIKQQPTQSSDDDSLIKNAKNFSLNWIQTVMPIGMNLVSTQQTQASSSQDDSNAPIMFYECPRCRLNYQQSQHTRLNESAHSGDVEMSDDTDVVSLDYIYRFWFVLRDARSQLEPCLLEGQIAEKFLESIHPTKFYTNQLKAHQVYKIIHRNFDKKYLLTIETFKLRSSNSNENIIEATPAPTPAFTNKLINKRKLDVLYKISDIEELISL